MHVGAYENNIWLQAGACKDVKDKVKITDIDYQVGFVSHLFWLLGEKEKEHIAKVWAPQENSLN